MVGSLDSGWFLGSFLCGSSPDSVTGLQYHVPTSICPNSGGGHYSHKLLSRWCPLNLWDVRILILSTHLVYIPVVDVLSSAVGHFRFLNTGRYDAPQHGCSGHPPPSLLFTLLQLPAFPTWCSPKETLLTHSIIQQLLIEHLLCNLHYVKHLGSTQGSSCFGQVNPWRSLSVCFSYL